MAAVEVISTVDLSSATVQRRLTDAERRVYTRWERKILDAFKTAWVGWLYQGRPAGAERNVSWKAWRSRIETTSIGDVKLVIENTEDYSSFVHRSGSNNIEWQRIWRGIEASLIPQLVADMQAEIIKALSVPSTPKKLGPRGGGTTVVRGITL